MTKSSESPNTQGSDDSSSSGREGGGPESETLTDATGAEDAPQVMDLSQASRTQHRRELNRLSKMRCRKRKSEEAKNLQVELSRLSAEYKGLRAENEQLRQEYTDCISDQSQPTQAGLNFSLQTPELAHQMAAAALMNQVSQPNQQGLLPSVTPAFENRGNGGGVQHSTELAGMIARRLLQQQSDNQLQSVQILQNLLRFDSLQTANAGQLSLLSSHPIAVHPFSMVGQHSGPPFFRYDGANSSVPINARHVAESNAFPEISSRLTRSDIAIAPSTQQGFHERETFNLSQSLMPTVPSGLQATCDRIDNGDNEGPERRLM